MKYLILITLIITACSNTTEPTVCNEYESVYIVTTNVDGVLEHEPYSNSAECVRASESYKNEGVSSSCQRIVDNTGCN